EGFVTQRDGRYVLPLKADFKGRVKGIIHDQSASGATIFVEPISVVELNNAWKSLQLAETQEINRILANLTRQVAEQSRFIAATVQALAELDLIFAKARFAEAIAATAPTLHPPDALPADTPRLDLRAARHPLLPAETVVPIDLWLAPETSMLVITGPNTGGKTVTLKTAGLLALMAQSGLHIPAAEGSQLMVFDAIFADIGDEQSLEQSLSTFSAHMNNIVSILNRCTPQSLVIFDELGAGTDPIEGAALAHAILNRLLAEKVTTLVATHFAELKAFAYTTPGVQNASMAFDVETLSPTFKLQIGIPGNSNAFAIAERLGLSGDILQQAQSLVDDETRETESMLAQIKADLDAAHMERLRVEEERAEAEYYRQKIEDRLANVENEGKEILKRARREAQKELDAVRAQLREIRREARKARSAEKPTGGKAPEHILKSLQTRLEKMEAEVQSPPVAAPQRPVKPLKVGQKVEIPHLNAKGVITALNKDEVEVQLGTFRTTLKRNKLHATAEPPPAETPDAATA
ncbi:MAG TPA: endonuclease MutS2, partial [Anaerolineae bacterium]|nr:endonuclease MutS2 [Anaerolineae bacterium]